MKNYFYFNTNVHCDKILNFGFQSVQTVTNFQLLEQHLLKVDFGEKTSLFI